MAEGWKRRFGDPIPLPRGRQLVSLEDAGKYITRLPKAELGTANVEAGRMKKLKCLVNVWLIPCAGLTRRGQYANGRNKQFR